MAHSAADEVDRLVGEVERYRGYAEAYAVEAQFWREMADRLVREFCGEPGQVGSVDAPWYYRDAIG